MLNGILVVRKEQGYTSNDVVVKLRGICRQKKIGHTGTLDPNATGVLPVCLGNATKLCDMLTDHKKEYIAELTLGKATDTQDIWGKVLSDSGEEWRKLSLEKIMEVTASFRGEQLQVPPMYSAIKVNGKRLYELARAGIEVERKARSIMVDEIEILPPKGAGSGEADGPGGLFSALPIFRIRLVCSKGTYVRTLCHDIGEKLGCGAVMSSLVRTKTGGFTLDDAYTLEELEKLRDEGRLSDAVMPVDACFSGYPALMVKESERKYLENGNELTASMLQDRMGSLASETVFRVYDADGVFYGVYLVQKDGRALKPWKMFLPGK